MLASDRIHDAVKNALLKDGWSITGDPFTINYEEVILFAHLRAERPIGAMRGDRRIVVEAKSFRAPSAMREFEVALGQYLIYRLFLSIVAADHRVYLAISEPVYERFFQQRAIQLVLQEYEVKLLVVNLETEEVVEWIS